MGEGERGWERQGEAERGRERQGEAVPWFCYCAVSMSKLRASLLCFCVFVKLKPHSVNPLRISGNLHDELSFCLQLGVFTVPCAVCSLSATSIYLHCQN